MDKLKKLIKTFVVLILMFCAMGCSNKTIDTKQFISQNINEYELTDSEEFNCAEININNKTYRPFCAAELENIDFQKIIGFYKDEQGDKRYIFCLKDISSSNWIVDTSVDEKGQVAGHTVGFIWKEINEKNIPDNISIDSNYEEWN